MASTYATRTFGTPTSAYKFTISFWVKRSKLGVSHIAPITAGTYGGGSATNMGQFLFSGDDTLLCQAYNAAGSPKMLQDTNMKFRDTNAWYHIVLGVDGTLATAGDRNKLYVNGVEITDFADDQNADQNTDLAWNQNGIVCMIGNRANMSYHFDGYLSHIHFIDGTQYAASDFGSTDATTGEWKINTSPNVTYGNNGFFILKDGNSLTDQSGNGNDFTLGGGTLTKSEDNPSNIFATLNPLKTLGTTSRTITNGNTRFNTTTTSWGTMLSTLGFSSGKFYCEVRLDTLQSSQGYGALGVTDATENYQSNDNITNQSSFSAGCVTDHRSGQSACKSAGSTVSSNIGDFATNNDIVGIAADMDNKALYLHKNGTYLQIGGVTGVPTSGSSKTGAITIPATCETCMFSISSYTTDCIKSVNFGNGYFGSTQISSAGTNASGIGIFEYDVPAGYTALSTKGLNL